MDRVIEARHGNLAVLNGLLQRIAEILRAGLLLIEAGERGVDGGVRAAPVGEDKAFEVPVFFQHLVEQVVILAGPVGAAGRRDGVAVVGAHDAGGIGQADRNLEREQIAFARGALIDDDVDGGAAGFLVVKA